MVAQTVGYNDLQDRQIGLGIATVVLGVLAGVILQYTRRVTSMPSYFVANYSFFRDKHPKLPLVATILYYIVLATPCILLIIWVIILGAKIGANPALPVLFVGLFVICIFIPSKSKYFYYKTLAMFLTYIIAEMLMLGLVFQKSNPNSFWALTALCLTLNAILVIICQWFIENTTWNIPENTPANIIQKIRKSVKIWKQQANPPEIIDGGIYGKVTNLSFGLRFAIISVIYVCSLIILGVYSTIGVYRTMQNFQALVNSVAIVTTDVITFMLIFISKQKGFNPNINAIVVILIRVCIIAFSGYFWFFGYCLLYLILMLFISVLIVNKYYPTYEKPPTPQITRVNIFKMPQTTFIVLVLMFSALVYYMGQDQGKTLPVFQAQISNHIYPFWAVGVSTILLSFAMFFYIITVRIVDRSQAKVRSINVYYLGCDNCGEYYVFLFASYAFLVILGCYLFTIVGNHIIWASCVFLPLFYQAFVIFYLNWKQNDYLLLGNVAQFNKKIKKKKQRQDKITNMKNSVINKMKQQNKDDQQLAVLDVSNLRIMDNAQIQSNIILDNIDNNQIYEQWRQNNLSIIQAIRGNKMLPTDKRILISIPIMILTLIGYSLAFFYSQNRDMTAFTVSVQIIVLFLLFIPTKRYFSTFQKPNIPQIIIFVCGLVLNYTFGIISYAVEWNNSPAYTVLWTVVNPYLIFTYAAYSFIRDKGLILVSIILAVLSMVFSFGPGIILLAWFRAIVLGIAFVAAGFFFTYFSTIYLIYLKMNNSVPFILYPITVVLIVGTCCAVMIYSFVNDSFDDFYGFSITYLVINLLALIYATYRMGSDILNRADKPNFYSPYGMPIYKYDFNIHSAVQNVKPMQFWLASWFMFYAYTVLMQIFMSDTNYGVSVSMIPLIIFALTFIEILTYNLYRAGKIKADITDQLLESSWEQVQKIRERSLGNFLNFDQLVKQLQQAQKLRQGGQITIKTKAIKVAPKQIQNDNSMNQHQNTATKIQAKDIKTSTNQPLIDMDINNYIYDLQTKLDKAIQNDKILLVNFWTNIIFKAQSLRKKRMLQFLNFIRDCGDLLSQAGIALVLNDTLYQIQLVYNQANQQLQTLSPLQRLYFQKQLKLYIQRKQKQQKQKQQIHRKQSQNDIKRQKQLQNRILNDKPNMDYPNIPLQKMNDGPSKLKKIKQQIKQTYSDSIFKLNNDIIPVQVRSMVKGWKRPSKDSYIMKNVSNTQNAGMQVRQGMIGNCYLISAIGVLGRDRIKSIITDISECPTGAYMVKFNKFNKDIYVIIDDNFPVGETSQDNQWIFGRCQDDKQLFCNIIQKGYAKLYGGYNNIVGGKVAYALADMTGGFPQEIQLKPYQQTNTNQIFQKMLQFQKAGYLMGAGSPPNAKGDAVQIDGIFQGHAYLIMDVRNLDGNKLIKLRNPHGNQSKESTLDWSDDSPKWTNRLKGLLGEKMGADGAFWMGLDDFVYVFRALYVCRIFDNSWTRVGPFFGTWKGQSAAGLKSTSGNAILSKNPHYGIKVNKACTLFIELTQNQVEQGRAKNKIFFMVQRNGGKRIDAPATNKMVGMSGAAINSKTISKQINLTADSFPYTFSMMAAIYETGVQGSFNISMYCNDKSIQVIQDAVFDR